MTKSTIFLRLELEDERGLGTINKSRNEKLSEFRFYFEGLTREVISSNRYPNDPFKYLENTPAKLLSIRKKGESQFLDYSKSFADNDLSDGDTLTIGIIGIAGSSINKRVTNYY
ncbi:MAG: hypothetical protein AAFV80_17785, partial [Bacteroidota bacterium]